MAVYARTRGGCTKKELPRHHQGTHHTVQKKAWFDEVNMLDWVKIVLAPDVAKFPTGITQSYSLIRFISLGVEVLPMLPFSERPNYLNLK
jgi:hypothetical protein